MTKCSQICCRGRGMGHERNDSVSIKVVKTVVRERSGT